jgi:uncharacterized membrane protein YidH (DUF202 family)
MRTQKRLEKISTAISLFALALGFSVLGLLIVAKGREDAASVAGGILGIFLGATFLIAACLHWKRGGNQVQGGFLAEEAPIVEIVSSEQAGAAICSF